MIGRRGFLKFLGTGAAAAVVAPILPSEVWPFRKIFIPTPLLTPAAPLSLAAIQAIELEVFAKEIPALFFKPSPMFAYVRRMTRELPEYLTGAYPALIGEDKECRVHRPSDQETRFFTED